MTELKAASPPTALTEPCDEPVELAAGALNAGRTAELWGQDRAALAACKGAHEGLSKFVHGLIDGLSHK